MTLYIAASGGRGRVYLDEAEIKDVVVCDDRCGFVIHGMRDDDGTLLSKDGEFVTDIKYGKVKFVRLDAD